MGRMKNWAMFVDQYNIEELLETSPSKQDQMGGELMSEC